MKNIYVTESFLPPLEEYEKYIKKIFDTKQLTNQGSLLIELEEKLKIFLGVENFQYVSNGTVALQLALSSLSLDSGEIITTPFSYVATVSSILWQRCKPVFVDINQENFTIDVDKIKEKITPQTKAILGVHVFGYACDVLKIEALAKEYNLKVIYDAAHAFGAIYEGKSLCAYGDISTLSFHATKIFHTAEGGACIIKDKSISKKIDLQKRFGHLNDDHFCLGINGKQSELHAAMGLANFPYIEKIIAKRKKISEIYDHFLATCVERPKKQENLVYNYAYYPVLFQSEEDLLQVFKALAKENIYPRRYFYPSLNTLPYIDYQECAVSEDVSKRIACLPLSTELSEENAEKISRIIKKNIVS